MKTNDVLGIIRGAVSPEDFKLALDAVESFEGDAGDAVILRDYARHYITAKVMYDQIKAHKPSIRGVKVSLTADKSAVQLVRQTSRWRWLWVERQWVKVPRPLTLTWTPWVGVKVELEGKDELQNSDPPEQMFYMNTFYRYPCQSIHRVDEITQGRLGKDWCDSDPQFLSAALLSYVNRN